MVWLMQMAITILAIGQMLASFGVEVPTRSPRGEPIPNWMQAGVPLIVAGANALSIGFVAYAWGLLSA